MRTSNLIRIERQRLIARPSFIEELRRHLHVRETTADGEKRTRVTLDRHAVPHPGPAGRGRLMLTTELAARLSPRTFARGAATAVNEASRQKGRAVFAVDLDTNEVVGAAAYHVPQRSSAPLVVTALAPRIDSASTLGRASIPILKACIHEIARLLGRPTRVELWTSGNAATEACELYGFRQGPRGSGRSSGSVFLVQAAPALDEPDSGPHQRRPG